MGNSDIAIEYTEERYSSRSEMSRNIGFQISDLMWQKVIDYRSLYNHVISLKWFGSKKFVLCVYPTFASRVNQIEVKLSRLVSQVSSLDKANGDADKFRLVCFKECAKELLKAKNVLIEDGRILKVLSSENPYDKDEEYFFNYIQALKYIDEKSVNNIDVDFLAELYSRVIGVPELTSFYRNRNDVNVNSLSVVSRVYESAPYEYIEPMMDSLFDFIQNGNIAVSEKALIAYEYILMVKPFANYNEEIAVLIAKAVLAHFSLGDNATLINLEVLNNLRGDEKRKINNEVQQNTDFTYALVNFVNLLDSSLNTILSLSTDYSVKELKNDFYKVDDIAEQPVKEEVVEEPEVVKEEPIIKPTVEPIREEKKVIVQHEEPKKVVSSPKGLAVNVESIVLDEKTAQLLEERLVEMDVFLKRKEAHFYARHCTLGMYYTIDQYKKSIKCVYETARTSMDHLTELGYYSKKQVGKKFVYTPIERKK